MKLEALSQSTGNRVKVRSTRGNPASTIELELDYNTAPDSNYPNKVQRPTRVKIDLSSRYPFHEPKARITTPIYHPNVYPSGEICLGTKWLPTQGLDLLVKRIIQIITFEPMILNAAHPANGQALNWYSSAVKKHPGAFPTDKLEVKSEQQKPKMAWKNMSDDSEERVIVTCPTCTAKLRVPPNREGNIACPKCKNKFAIKT